MARRGRNVATTLAAEELYMKSPSTGTGTPAYVNCRFAAPPSHSPSASQPNTTLRICQLKPTCPPATTPLGPSQVGDLLSMTRAASVPQPSVSAPDEMLSSPQW